MLLSACVGVCGGSPAELVNAAGGTRVLGMVRLTRDHMSLCLFCSVVLSHAAANSYQHSLRAVLTARRNSALALTYAA